MDNGKFPISKKITLLIVVALIAIIAGLVYAFQGDSGPEPRVVLERYMNHWENGDYASMYELLSMNAKQQVTKKEFIKKHESIAKGIKQQKIQLKLGKSSEKEVETIPFSSRIETDTVGVLSFQNRARMVEDDEGWRVAWTPSLIFPQLKDGDRVAVLRTAPGTRGEITDRNGEPLAVNTKKTAVGMVPNEVLDPEKTCRELAKALNRDPQTIRDRLKRGEKKDPNRFIPIQVFNGKGGKEVDTLKKIPGVSAQDASVRVYPQKELTAHITGYIRPITKEQLKKYKEKGGYQPGDWIGHRGLESDLEERLRGTPGWKVVISREDGKQKAVLGETPAKSGENIQITIDLKTQEQLYRGIKNDKGAGVALNPKTGEILAMVSAPSYDPNQFIQGLSQAEWSRISGPDQPLANRAKLTYAPGSTMKPITAAIGLDTKTITPDTSYNTDEGKWQKDSSWGGYYVTRVDNPGGGVDLAKALAWSDNIYFARVGLKIGAAKTIEYYKKFGFNKKLKNPEITPSQFSNNNKLDNEILLADTSYGQGQLLVSPLHLAAMYTTFTNDGDMIKPYLILDPDQKGKRMIWKKNVISPDTATKVKELLRGVVELPKGSARDLKTAGVDLGAKTGTAELKASKDDKNNRQLGWLAWMAGKKGQESDLVVATMVDEVQDRGGSHYIFPAVKKMLAERYR
ncbi:penicillin-binding protein 3 [Kroppenstedtia guangzhouensis]|uniref:Penicillin-binding protein 3 n=1 Tax=Kroppenstedtia guangzhouensis TaxID=1274356 RepID=A0ABQ1GCX7_9BACL|nr:penicillin-binding transpeptidase domain-containing protein [Kroppenstedtia guangzhouensis]GGA41288.1 penicillin-binding protein 3 [Kroppenstedtia guangzhouensis]